MLQAEPAAAVGRMTDRPVQRHKPSEMLKGYAIAVLAVTVAAALRWALVPYIHEHAPFATLYAAVAAAAWLGGAGPALLAILLGYATADLLYVLPVPHGSASSAEVLARLLTYSLSALVIAALGVTARNATRKLAAANALMRERQAHLELEALERKRAEQEREQLLEREQLSRNQAERAEAQLRERVEELQTLMDLVPIGIYLAHDAECTRITGNRAGADLVGTPDGGNLSMTPAAPALEVRPHRLFYQGRELRPEELPIQQAVRERVELRDRDYELHFEDGTLKHLYGSAVPLFDQQGRVRGGVAAFLDITARKAAEQRLQAEHRRLTSVLESVGQCFYALDREWRFTYINARAEKFYAVPKAGMLGRSVWDVFPNAIGGESWEQYHRALREGQPVLFEMRSMASGRWIEVHAYPSEEGLSVFFEDVHERKLTEEALRESRERFEAFMAHSPALAWIKDETGRYAFANPAVERMRNQAMRGRTDAELLDATVAAALRTNDLAVLASDTPQQFLERFVQHGEERLVLSVKFPIASAGGRRYVAGMGIDVTEQMRAEQALRQADRRKDEFLATLAHELRNPLNPIRSAVALLNIRGPADPELQWARAVIDRQVQQMARLLDDLLDVSRLTLNKLQLRKEQLDLGKVIERAVETSRPLIEAADHHLDIHLPAHPVLLAGDPMRLEQVFSNLLNNAAKYTERGGRLSLAVRCEGAQVVVTMSDNGIGILPEQLQQVFEMFAQVGPEHARTQGGLGIGLALVRALVEMHGGTVVARSEGRGRGSEFEVRLPLAQALPQEIKSAPPAGSLEDGCALQVLVVDDNIDSAEGWTLLLRALGYDVRCVNDGHAALRAADAFRPDAVLLDIGLPGLNGYEVAQWIRAQPWGADVLLIATTGWGQADDKRRAAEAGFDHHLTKPVSPDAVKQLLAGRRRSNEAGYAGLSGGAEAGHAGPSQPMGAPSSSRTCTGLPQAEAGRCTSG